MHPIDFEGSNITFTKPPTMTDEECSDLKAWIGEDSAGNVGVLTVWMPNKEDLEALNSGRPLYVKTLGTSFAPMSLFTSDENDNPNF